MDVAASKLVVYLLSTLNASTRRLIRARSTARIDHVGSGVKSQTNEYARHKREKDTDLDEVYGIFRDRNIRRVLGSMTNKSLLVSSAVEIVFGHG